MDASEQAEAILGRGRGAMVSTFFGAIWLGLGLAAAGRFSFWIIIAFSACCLALFAGALSLMRLGRRRRSKNPGRPERNAAIGRQFMWVLIAEVAAFVAIGWGCSALKRFDLIALGVAAVVGLHFFPLARIFRAPQYYVTGSAIVIWCVVSWVLFRAYRMDTSAAIGTGAILWLAGAYGLISARARRSSSPREPASAALSE